MHPRATILFLCTGNSCRSQMAEGLCRHFKDRELEAFSAGIERHGLNPLAVEVMGEIGIDISAQQSKTLNDLAGHSFDYVVTVCDHARESCPLFPGESKVIHRSFADPPSLAAAAGSDEEALPHYRRVRDELKEFILALPAELLAVP
ncbi:arsenate reductase ArsC [Desulfogranum mediterraneum]|uniref:arsenate reductase ArsC n=1 Tax=Desulfogranum mediterraneum TaxID=160661 RepID=UPI0004059FF6|nr:arsenate reductase ArsC [Desulfogranum mediterraneum]